MELYEMERYYNYLDRVVDRNVQNFTPSDDQLLATAKAIEVMLMLSRDMRLMKIKEDMYSDDGRPKYGSVFIQREKIKASGWVNVYSHPNNGRFDIGLYFSKEDAIASYDELTVVEKSNAGELIACVYVEGEEK